MTQFKPKPFGEYYLLERIAVGGMAEIFKAKTYGVGGFEKQIAIKRILPHHAQNQEFISMLIDEAKIAVALNHVNIVQVFDLGKIENDYFIAMEYVEGRDLRSVLRRSKEMDIPLPVENAVYIILEICKGLDYAHRKTDKSGKALDVIHRDISPQNILISFEGEVKIVDFGIAKAANKVTETDSGILKGKFSYMSPEQASGKKLDRRTDIFSTGLILFELLTGNKFFKGKSHIEILDKIKNTYIEPPFLPSDIPSELEFILASALVHQRENRYAYASDFQVELSRFLYSSSLDFTARNLSQFMRKLFTNEMEEERNREKVDFQVDEATRSLMLKGHAESLVSKTDFSMETGSGEKKIKRKNKTIIKKFQNILRQRKNILDQNPPEEGTQPMINSSESIPDLSEKGFGGEKTKKIRIFKQETFEDDTDWMELGKMDSLKTFASHSIKKGVTSLRDSSPQIKIRVLVVLIAIFAILMVLGVYFSQTTSVPLATEEEESHERVTLEDLPKETPTPVKKISQFANVNFDPQTVHKKSGYLTIETIPDGAKITTGKDRFLGDSPIRLTNVPPEKRFSLTVEIPNYRIWEDVFILKPGEEKNLSVNLEPKFGTIIVDTAPAMANIYINDKFVGKSPLAFNKIVPDTPFLLMIKKPGFEEYTRTFKVGPEEEFVFKKSLEEAIRTLYVESQPRGAQVFLNGVTRGVTPMELIDLTPGEEYFLVLRKPGYRDYLQKIKLSGERGERISAKLEPQTGRLGTLFIDSDPPGANVSINGKMRKERTPAVFEDLTIGEFHLVKITLGQYEPEEFKIQVQSDKVTKRKAVLQHLKARISVRSEPPKAGIYLNNQLIGETPLPFFSVKSGTKHTLAVRKKGFEEQVKRFQLNPDQKQIFDFNLDPIQE